MQALKPIILKFFTEVPLFHQGLSNRVTSKLKVIALSPILLKN